MNKILLEQRTDGVYDANGAFLGAGIYTGFPYEETEQKSNMSIQDIIKLKEAGFTSDEITDLKDKGVV